MSWIAVVTALFKPVIVPLLTGLVGWLIPSPAQLLAKKEAATHQAEQSGTNLDQLP